MSSIQKTMLFLSIFIVGMGICIFVSLSNRDSSESVKSDLNNLIETENNKSDELLLKEFSDLDDKSLALVNSFIDSYFVDMNKNKSEIDIDNFSSKYFTEEFINNINVEGVLDTLEEYRKNNKGYEFKYEIMYIKEDKVHGGYYVGIREWSEITYPDDSIRNSDYYIGVYILDKVNNELKISEIVDENLTVPDVTY